MELHHKSHTNTDVITLKGRFDAYEVPQFNQWLEANPTAKQVVVNLQDANFIDSAGLAALVKGLKRCRQNEGDLYLAAPSPAVRIILELTRMDKAFRLFNDEALALAAFEESKT